VAASVQADLIPRLITSSGVVDTSRKKLTDRKGRSDCHGDGLKLDLEAELGELSNETLGFGFARALVEILDAKVSMFDAVFQDMVDRGQQ
jgi:hypothetical protein